MIAMESMILFKQNKTAEWLKTKSDEEKREMFQACIKLGRQQRMIHKQRKQQIHLYRQETLKLRQEALACKQKKEREKMITICKQICKLGIYRTKEDISINLAKISSENKKKEALKMQIRFRLVILKQSFPDKSVYHFSKGGKQLKSGDLAKNLTKLIEAAPKPFNEIEILYNPKLLVGIQIRHRFMNEDGSLEWFDGLVINLISEVTYEVIYNDENEVYQFELLEDYREGDLQLIL